MHTTFKWIKLKEVKSFNIFKFLKLLRIEYTNCIVYGLHLFENFIVKRSFSIYNKLEKLKKLFIKLLFWFNIKKKRLIEKKKFLYNHTIINNYYFDNFLFKFWNYLIRVKLSKNNYFSLAINTFIDLLLFY